MNAAQLRRELQARLAGPLADAEAVLAEDGITVVVTGYTDADEFAFASFELPEPMALLGLDFADVARNVLAGGTG